MAEGGFSVDTEALRTASRGISEATRDLEPGVVRGLCGQVEQYGSDAIHSAFAEFCEKWDYGVDVLIDDTEGMCGALDAAVDSYGDGDENAVQRVNREAQLPGGS